MLNKMKTELTPTPITGYFRLVYRNCNIAIC